MTAIQGSRMSERIVLECVNLQIISWMMLHIYSQLMSPVWCFEVIKVIRTMEMIMTMTVREKMAMRPSFFPQEIRTFHNISTGIVMTARILANRSGPVSGELTCYIAGHVEYTATDLNCPLIRPCRWAIAFRFNGQFQAFGNTICLLTKYVFQGTQ